MLRARHVQDMLERCVTGGMVDAGPGGEVKAGSEVEADAGFSVGLYACVDVAFCEDEEEGDAAAPTTVREPLVVL